MKLFNAAPTFTAGVWRLLTVAVCSLLLLIGTLYWNLQWVRTEKAEVERTAVIEREIRALSQDLLEAESAQRGFLLSGQPDYLSAYLAAADAPMQRMAHLRALIVDPEARAVFGRLEPVIAAKLAEVAETIALVNDGQTEAAVRLLRTGRGMHLMDAYREDSAALLRLEHRLLEARNASFLTSFNRVFLTAALGGVVAITILLVFAVHTTRRLVQPIATLLAGIRAMGEGHLDHRVPLSAQDEIGRISAAFNTMAGHLQGARQARDGALLELQRSNAELDSFAYSASHDLKAPLRGIRNLAQWIREDLRDDTDAETLENLRLLDSRVDRLDRLLESLLAYSRIGRTSALSEIVDSGRLVADIWDYLAPPAGFVLACPDPMPTLLTPRAPLEQVLRNLIGNAIKHHDRAHARIEVSARACGDCIEFRISDDGPGVPPEFHERIFQMFQTLKPRDQMEGSGMGLAIVRKAVEAAGGSVRVQSAHPERGTTFLFTWPAGTHAGD